MLTKRSRYALLKGIITRRSPIYVQFAVSKNCNLRCKMCGAVDSRKHEKELDLEEIGKLANVLEKLKVGVVILTGGEPFLRKDLAEIIHIFSSKGFDTKLQTNGILADEVKIKRLVEAGLKDVTISLDTLNEKKIDYITNAKDSFHKIIKSISLFSYYLPKKGNMSIINSVVSRLTINDVLGVVKFTTRIGFYSSIIPVHLSNSSDFIVRKEAEAFKFKKDDFEIIDKTYSKLIKMKKQGYNVHNSTKFLKACPDFLKYNKINWKCDSPNLFFSISPQGNFLPCVDIPGEVSMLDDNFINIFKSKTFLKSIRDKVNKCPGCMYACYPEVSYLCKNPLVLFERTFQGIKISRKVRKPVSYEKSLEVIKQIRGR